MAQGKIGRVYEVSCKQCGKVEVLAKTLLGSQKHLRLLGWRETQAHDWYCSECRDHASRVIVAPYHDPEKCYTNEDKS